MYHQNNGGYGPPPVIPAQNSNPMANQQPYGGSSQGGSYQQTGGKQYNDTLHQICSYGFPFNHLITVALMQRIPAPNLNVTDYKEKFFFFLTMAPGVGSGAQRTYDFRQGKISQKFSTREVAGLADILRQCAIGNDANVLPYVKFSRNQGQQKSFSVWTSYKQETVSGNQINVRSINVTVNSGSAKHTIGLSADQALGISKILDKMFEKSFELEVHVQQQAIVAATNYNQTPMVGNYNS